MSAYDVCKGVGDWQLSAMYVNPSYKGSCLTFCSRYGHQLCSILTGLRAFLVALLPLTLQVEMSQLSFVHILNLSFSWHTRRKTGEILRVLDRGAAINHTFEVGAYMVYGARRRD